MNGVDGGRTCYLIKHHLNYRLLWKTGAQIWWKIVMFLTCKVCTPVLSEVEEKEAGIFIDYRATVFIEEPFSLEMLVPFHFWLACRWQTLFEALKTLLWKLNWTLSESRGKGKRIPVNQWQCISKKKWKKKRKAINRSLEE